MNPTLKTFNLKLLIKLLFVVAVFYWLFKSGKIDLNILRDAMLYKKSWILCLFTLMLQNWLVSQRWLNVLQYKTNKKIPVSNIFLINWIGHFFSSILPGAILGSLLKIKYFEENNLGITNKYLIFSIFFERIVGMIGLIFISGILSLFIIVLQKEQSQSILTLSSICLAGFAITVVTIYLLLYQSKWMNKLFNVFFRFNFFKKFETKYRQLMDVLTNKQLILKSILISVFIQMLSIIGFSSIIIPHTETQRYLELFSFIPLGNLAIAFPILPLGIGVGHLVYENLLNLINIKSGATYFNIYLICSYIVNLIGVIPFLFYAKKLKIK